MQTRNLPPVPDPPPDYSKLAKIAISLIGIGSLLFFGLSLASRKHSESIYKANYQRLNDLLSNGSYEQCFNDRSGVPLAYKETVESLKDRCKSLYLNRLIENVLNDSSSYGKDINYWKGLLGKVDSLSSTEQERTELRSRISQRIISLSDRLLLGGDISRVLGLLALIGDKDQAAKLAEAWELDKQRFESSKQTITDVNAKTHDPFANNFTTEYQFPYWQKQFESMIAELESKRRTRLLDKAQDFAQKRDWISCIQISDQVRRENTNYKSSIELEVNRKANELLKTCFYAKDAEEQQER